MRTLGYGKGMRIVARAWRTPMPRGASTLQRFRDRIAATSLGSPLLGPCEVPLAGGRLAALSTASRSSPTAPLPLVVALDLDECLVHSTNFGHVSGHAFDPFRQNESVRPDVVKSSTGVEKFELSMGSGNSCTVYKRCGVDDFLAECATTFETYVYTAGVKMYADPLLDVLDPRRLLAGRLFRSECVPVRAPGPPGGQDHYLKDISVVAQRAGRGGENPDLSRVVLVDNNPLSFVCQPRNGVPVPHFVGEPDDVLPQVLDLLRSLNNSPNDVRPRLHNLFRMEEQLSENPVARLLQQKHNCGSLSKF